MANQGDSIGLKSSKFPILKCSRPPGFIFQYGTMTPMGHVDFYAGAGEMFGWSQPGCGEVSQGVEIKF